MPKKPSKITLTVPPGMRVKHVMIIQEKEHGINSDYLGNIMRGSSYSSIFFGAPQPPQLPPESANFLLHVFLSRKDAESEIGDIEEWYTAEILPRYNGRKARFLFWTHAIRTILYRNLFSRWLLRITVAGGIAKLGAWLSRSL